MLDIDPAILFALLLCLMPVANVLGASCCCTCGCLSVGSTFTDDFSVDQSYNDTDPPGDQDDHPSLCYTCVPGENGVMTAGSGELTLTSGTVNTLRRCLAATSDMDGLFAEAQFTLATYGNGNNQIALQIGTGDEDDVPTERRLASLILSHTGVFRVTTFTDSGSNTDEVSVTQSDGDTMKLRIEDDSSGAGEFTVRGYHNGTEKVTLTGQDFNSGSGSMFDPPSGITFAGIRLVIVGATAHIDDFSATLDYS